VVAWCIENRYLDDDRFVASLSPAVAAKAMARRASARSSTRKGLPATSAKGDARVRYRLGELAKEQAQRKYGEPLPRLCRKSQNPALLLYRGYLMEDIQEIWRNFAD
jgi:regulatory protein